MMINLMAVVLDQSIAHKREGGERERERGISRIVREERGVEMREERGCRKK